MIVFDVSCGLLRLGSALRGKRAIKVHQKVLAVAF